MNSRGTQKSPSPPASSEPGTQKSSPPNDESEPVTQESAPADTGSKGQPRYKNVSLSSISQSSHFSLHATQKSASDNGSPTGAPAEVEAAASSDPYHLIGMNTPPPKGKKRRKCHTPMFQKGAAMRLLEGHPAREEGFTHICTVPLSEDEKLCLEEGHPQLLQGYCVIFLGVGMTKRINVGCPL